MNCYVDSSVILRYLLSPDRGFEQVQDFDMVGSSELLRIECQRVLHRYRLTGMLTDPELERAVSYFLELYDGIRIFEISNSVKSRASETFPTVVGSLDAIHLSTTLLWAARDASPCVLFTYDSQMKTCAHSLGIRTV